MKLGLILERFFGRKVTPESVVTLKGDASSRKYHRVTMGSGQAPKEMVVMELPEDTQKSDEATQGQAQEELPFLNVGRHLRDKGLRVPKVYLDAVGERILLLEDLGDDLFFDRVDDASFETMQAWYEAGVDLLVDMHEKMWPIPKGCMAGTRRFDYELLRWELDHYREWGIEALNDQVLDTDVRKNLDGAFDALAREVAALKEGFVHRDYQSRNLMVLNGAPSPDNLAIIDFQDALEGPRVYDLVALLNDSYVDVPEPLKEQCISRYAERTGTDPDQIAHEFHLVSVQRKLKDGGRFVFIDRVKQNPWFLPFIEGSFERVQKSLDKLDGQKALKTALAAADPTRFGKK